MKSIHSLFAVSYSRVFKVGLLSLSVVSQVHAETTNSSALAVQEPTATPQTTMKSTDTLKTDSTLSAKEQLVTRLSKISTLASDFTQKVLDEEGTLLQEGSGNLLIQKPNKVRWHTQSPEESLIISDGETLWFYDPFIEQVSAHNLSDAIANTPIMMLTSNDEMIWNDYNISQSGETSFIIVAKDANSQVKSLAIDFSEAGLSAFTISDSTGQQSIITLKNIAEGATPDAKLFSFEIPEGVYLDDQR